MPGCQRFLVTGVTSAMAALGGMLLLLGPSGGDSNPARGQNITAGAWHSDFRIPSRTLLKSAEYGNISGSRRLGRSVSSLRGSVRGS